MLPETTRPFFSVAPSCAQGSGTSSPPPGNPVAHPVGRGGSGKSGAHQRSHLSLWHRGEAQFPVGDEGVLHGVHSEAVKGGLGAHVVLKAFGHSAIESGPNRGPSASLWLRHAGCLHFHPQGSVTPVPRPLYRPLPLSTSARSPAPTPLLQTSRDTLSNGHIWPWQLLPPGSPWHVCLHMPSSMPICPLQLLSRLGPQLPCPRASWRMPTPRLARTSSPPSCSAPSSLIPAPHT